MRRWVLLLAAVCVAPAVVGLVATWIHPSAVANIILSTKRIPFLTDSLHILSPNDNERLMVTEIASLQMELPPDSGAEADGQPVEGKLLQIQGRPGATCAFYRVRSSSFELSGPALITLETLPAPRDGQKARFVLKSHGAMKATLSSQAVAGGGKPGFLCRRIVVNGEEADEVQGNLAATGGDLMSLVTAEDTRIDFEVSPDSQIGDGQIPLVGELRFSEIDPLTAEEKTVLLKPPSGSSNEVSFDNLDKKVTLDDADLIVVEPGSDFYLRQFTIKNGIQLSMHGMVRDVRTGAGASDLQSRMPSWFDHLDNDKRLWGVIFTVAGVFLGTLEKMGLLPKHETTS